MSASREYYLFYICVHRILYYVSCGDTVRLTGRTLKSKTWFSLAVYDMTHQCGVYPRQGTLGHGCQDSCDSWWRMYIQPVMETAKHLSELYTINRVSSTVCVVVEETCSRMNRKDLLREWGHACSKGKNCSRIAWNKTVRVSSLYAFSPPSFYQVTLSVGWRKGSREARRLWVWLSVPCLFQGRPTCRNWSQRTDRCWDYSQFVLCKNWSWIQSTELNVGTGLVSISLFILKLLIFIVYLSLSQNENGLKMLYLYCYDFV